MKIRTFILAAIAITTIATTSACGDSATPPPGIEPAVTFRLVVNPVRDPEEKTEVELDRISGIAVVAIRPPEGAIELSVEDRAEPRLSVTNLAGEEILVSLLSDRRLVAEVPLLEGDSWFFGDSQ